jgi:hypothetical protein
VREQDLGSRPIQSSHAVDGDPEIPGHRLALTGAGYEQPGAERLREHERVAGPTSALAQESIGMGRADHGKAVLGFRIADRVASGERPAALPNGFRGAVEHLGHDVAWQLIGERRDRQREQDAATHREHVAHRVRCGDLPEGPRVVDQRREEVDRPDDREVVADAIRSRVIGRLEPGDQLVRRRLCAEPGQRLRQEVGAEFRRTTPAVGQGRQS